MKKTKTRILGEWVTIEYVKDLADEEGNKVWGLCNADTRTISLNADMEPALMERTLKHEKTHMILRLSGLFELISIEVEEALATLMEIHIK